MEIARSCLSAMDRKRPYYRRKGPHRTRTDGINRRRLPSACGKGETDMKLKFTADDGTEFATEAECKEYEAQQNILDLLEGMSKTSVMSALARTDTQLADAIERAGNIIAARRRES